MADYTLVINTGDDKFFDTITWSASGGDGLSSGDPLVLQVGDRVRVQNIFTDGDGDDSTWNGSATIQGWQVGYWNSSSNLVVNANTTSGYRTIQSAAGGQTDSITAVDTSGANPGNISSVFYMSIGAVTDQIPDDWNWVDQPGAEISTLYESQTHTLTGMDTAASMTFFSNSHDTPEMQIDGGTWTAVASTVVNNGTTIRLRATSSSSYSTSTHIYTAFEGTARGNGWSIGTRAPNQVPDDWNWVDQPGAQISTVYYSQIHTLAGMEAAASMTFFSNSHDTPEMQIDGGTWTAVAATVVNNGTTVRLRATSSSSYGTSTHIYTAFEGTARGNGWSIGTITLPVTSITLNPTALNLTVGTTQWTVTVSGGSSLDTYQIRDSSGTEHESRNGNGDITVTDVPTTQEVYTAYAKRSAANGGGNTYIDTGKTITITMGTGGIQAPVISSIGIVDIDGTDATATVNLSANGSGGTLKYIQHTTSTPPATGWQTSNSFTQPYSTTRYYFASQDEDTSGAYDTEVKTLGAYNAGSSIYGMQVFNAAGDLTLDTTYRVPGVVTFGSTSVNSGTTAVGTPSTYTGTSADISFPGMTPTNSSEFEVWILDNIPAAGAWSSNQFTINRGTNLFTVTFRTDTSNYTLNFDYIGMRF